MYMWRRLNTALTAAPCSRSQALAEKCALLKLAPRSEVAAMLAVAELQLLREHARALHDRAGAAQQQVQQLTRTEAEGHDGHGNGHANGEGRVVQHQQVRWRSE